MNPTNRFRTPTLSAGLLALLFYSAAPQAQLPADVAATSDLIPDQYIVVFKPEVNEFDEDISIDVPLLAQTFVMEHGGTLLRTYQHALQGFAAILPTSSIAAIQLDPRVAYIEQDRLAYLDATQSNPPSWGLNRIDQRDLPLDTSYVYDFTGSGVRVYIIDTGIRITHTDFGTRASYGYDAFDGSLPADDCNGHGTHVAGTVGGAAHGVAKAAQLIAVRVTDCAANSSTSIIIAGLDWVAGQKTSNPSVPSVANMSVRVFDSLQAMDDAVANAVAKGVVVVASAGNNNTDACQQSPARAPAAITVGATTITDARASYSNFGTCVDLFAPGSGITSTWYTSDTATNTISGTSMASPHVAGVAALYLQTNACAPPATVSSTIINNATAGEVTNPGTGSPNRLLYSLNLVSSAPGVPPSISANPTFSTGGYYTVSWGAASGTVSHYEIQRQRNYSGTWSASRTVTGLSTNYSSSSSSDYLHRVRACNSSGCSCWLEGAEVSVCLNGVCP